DTSAYYRPARPSVAWRGCPENLGPTSDLRSPASHPVAWREILFLVS
ncbi:hypothetical protein A2U01_0081518, partial [Trifolium medium]|nr:hypothetical protein [Trifolium medium]